MTSTTTGRRVRPAYMSAILAEADGLTAELLCSAGEKNHHARRMGRDAPRFQDRQPRARHREGLVTEGHARKSLTGRYWGTGR